MSVKKLLAQVVRVEGGGKLTRIYTLLKPSFSFSLHYSVPLAKAPSARCIETPDPTCCSRRVPFCVYPLLIVQMADARQRSR
jgi:hypothetical protein